jgi:hypothetical protein
MYVSYMHYLTRTLRQGRELLPVGKVPSRNGYQVQIHPDSNPANYQEFVPEVLSRGCLVSCNSRCGVRVARSCLVAGMVAGEVLGFKLVAGLLVETSRRLARTPTKGWHDLVVAILVRSFAFLEQLQDLLANINIFGELNTSWWSDALINKIYPNWGSKLLWNTDAYLG